MVGSRHLLWSISHTTFFITRGKKSYIYVLMWKMEQFYYLEELLVWLSHGRTRVLILNIPSLPKKKIKWKTRIISFFFPWNDVWWGICKIFKIIHSFLYFSRKNNLYSCFPSFFPHLLFCLFFFFFLRAANTTIIN